MRHYGDAECHYDVENGIVWFTERGNTRVVAKFKSDAEAEAYLACRVLPKRESKKKTQKTSGKYEQKNQSITGSGVRSLQKTAVLIRFCLAPAN